MHALAAMRHQLNFKPIVEYVNKDKHKKIYFKNVNSNLDSIIRNLFQSDVKWECGYGITSDQQRIVEINS